MTYLLTARAKARQALPKSTGFTTNVPINGPPESEVHSLTPRASECCLI